MYPKKKIVLTTYDFPNFTDQQLSDFLRDCLGKFDKILEDFAPGNSKPFTGLIVNFYLADQEVKKRFPDRYEEMKHEFDYKKILEKLNIETND